MEKKTRVKWTEDEEDILRTALKKGRSHKDIIKDLPGRTETAIKIRAMYVAREEIKNTGAKTEDVLDKYGVDVDEYKKYLNDMEKQAERNKARKETSAKGLATVVEELTARVVVLENEIRILKTKTKKSSKK